MLLLGAATVLTAGLAGCAADGSRGTTPKVALVIGNAAYENAPALVNPSNDAADMCAALRRLGFRTTCHTNVRDRAEFDRLVHEYAAQLGPRSVGVFYYAGHGVQVAGASYLIPTRAEPDEAAANPVRVMYGVDELFERMRGRPVHFQLVVLDACRNDLFAETAGAAAGRGQGPATGRAAPSRLLRALQAQPQAGAGLAPIKDAPPGTIVLYATASREAAYDGEGRNGPLTRHVLEHIGTRGLPVEEFFKRVTAGVEAQTLRDYRKRQTPFIYGSFTGRFCFAGCPGDTLVPPAF
ncbi:MAG: caspase family protein [Rubrivivax sp.]|nr:caspase family protein [Rubrivivax sp.]